MNQQQKSEVSRVPTGKIIPYLAVRQGGWISWNITNSSLPSVRIDVLLKDSLKQGFYKSDVAMTSRIQY